MEEQNVTTEKTTEEVLQEMESVSNGNATDQTSGQNTTEGSGTTVVTYQVDQIDYTEMLGQIQTQLETQATTMVDIRTEIQKTNELQATLSGFALFFVIVILCSYVYKFFRIFI